MSELNNNLQEELQKIAKNTQINKSKLGTIFGFLTTMRSDNTQEHKNIIIHTQQVLELLKMMKRTLDIYFIIIAFLSFISLTKMLLLSAPILKLIL